MILITISHVTTIGTRYPNLSDCVTHVVVGGYNVNDMKKIAEMEDHPTVVTVEWLVQCSINKTLLPTSPYGLRINSSKGMVSWTKENTNVQQPQSQQQQTKPNHKQDLLQSWGQDENDENDENNNHNNHNNNFNNHQHNNNNITSNNTLKRKSSLNSFSFYEKV
eukprot:Awhi_evm1s854